MSSNEFSNVYMTFSSGRVYKQRLTHPEKQPHYTNTRDEGIVSLDLGYDGLAGLDTERCLYAHLSVPLPFTAPQKVKWNITMIFGNSPTSCPHPLPPLPFLNA